jgi:hypothetical protein
MTIVQADVVRAARVRAARVARFMGLAAPTDLTFGSGGHRDL